MSVYMILEVQVKDRLKWVVPLQIALAVCVLFIVVAAITNYGLL